MKTFILALSALEIVHLLRDETNAAQGQPELNTTCERGYIIEENFDHRVYGIHDEERFDLVTSVTTLTIEPRRESGYWVLSVIVEREFGLISTSEEDEMTSAELTLDEFELELNTRAFHLVIESKGDSGSEANMIQDAGWKWRPASDGESPFQRSAQTSGYGCFEG